MDVFSIISYSHIYKTERPNCYFIKFLIVLNKNISIYLASLFQLLLLPWKFKSILKICNRTPIHKKDSIRKYSEHRSISSLSNIAKFLERIIYNELYMYLYSLQFQFGQNRYSTNHALKHLYSNKTRKSWH